MSFRVVLAAGAAGVLLALSGTAATACDSRAACKAERVAAKAHTWHKTRVMVRPARTRYVYEPAQYETRKQRMMVRPERDSFRIIPAKYEWRKTRVMVMPARDSYRWEPAVYKTVKKRIATRGCMTRVIRTRGGCEVRKPAERAFYVNRRVRVSGGRLVKVAKPAVYAWRKKLVKVSPARVEKVRVPAMYINHTVSVKVRDGRRVAVDVPARYSWRMQRVAASGSKSVCGARAVSGCKIGRTR